MFFVVYDGGEHILQRPAQAASLPVDKGVEEGENYVGGQFGPLCHGPGDNSSRCSCEGQLEEENSKNVAHPLPVSVHEEAADTDERIAAVRRAKTEAEPEGPVTDPTEGHVQRVLHHDVHLVLRRHAAGLEQTEPWQEQLGITSSGCKYVVQLHGHFFLPTQ